MKKPYAHTESEQRVRAAIATMPYGGLQAVQSAASRVGFDGHTAGAPRPVELDTVANYLEALAHVLKEISQEHALEHLELAALRQDLAAVRRVFGEHDYCEEGK